MQYYPGEYEAHAKGGYCLASTGKGWQGLLHMTAYYGVWFQALI